jgi:hypothetical protein
VCGELNMQPYTVLLRSECRLTLDAKPPETENIRAHVHGALDVSEPV